MAVQILEGYILFSMGVENYGTQLKLSAILTGVIVCALAYKYIKSNINQNCKILKLLGDDSFGIYYLHLLILHIVRIVLLYSGIFPLNTIIVICVTLIIIELGKKVLGKYKSCFGFNKSCNQVKIYEYERK